MHGERVGPTVAVWAGALIGAAYKLAFPVGLRRPSLVAFLLQDIALTFGAAPPAAGYGVPIQNTDWVLLRPPQSLITSEPADGTH